MGQDHAAPTVGDVFRAGYRFGSIPDGISVRPRGHGRVDLFVNHETSKVPFPTSRRTRRDERESDFDNSQVSELSSTGGGARSTVPPSSRARRLPAVLLQLPCDEQGGVRPRDPVHERGVPGLRVPTEDSGRPRSVTPDEEENGVVLALDVKSKQSHVGIYGMGRHNHENNVAIPGFDDLVVLSGDDTFTSGPLTGVPAPPEGTPSILRPGLRTVAAVLVHHVGHGFPARRRRGSLGIRCGRPRPFRRERLQRLLRLRPRFHPVHQRSFHRGAEGDRDREERRRLGSQGRGLRLPVAAHERKLAARPPLRGYPNDPTDRHRRSPVGAPVLEPDQRRLRLRPRRGHRL